MVEKREVTKNEKVLESLISTHMQLKSQIFNTTSILLVVTSLMFSILSGFFITKFDSLDIFLKIAGAVLILSSLITLLLCLWSIKPKLKHKKPETEYYFMDVLRKFKSKEEYIKRIERIIRSDDKTIRFYIDEYWELGQKVLLPDFKKIKIAIDVLSTGIIIAFILVIISFILRLI